MSCLLSQCGRGRGVLFLALEGCPGHRHRTTCFFLGLFFLAFSLSLSLKVFGEILRYDLMVRISSRLVAWTVDVEVK